MVSVSSTTDVPRSNLLRGSGVSLGEALDGHRNSLGVLRLILASLVIVDHAFPLGGFDEDPFWRYTNGQTSLGGLAVGGFFAVSGYLIVKSGVATDVVQFLWRRAIRIFPAFWGVLVFAAFVVGPSVWWAEGRPLGEYFTLGPGGPFGYVTANWTLSIGAYGIHDLFVETPYGQTVQASVLNGSLWTLAYEWGFYLLIAVLAVSAVLARARIVVPALTGAFLVAHVASVVAPDRMGAILPLLADPQVIFLGTAFLVGSTLGIYSERIAYDDRLGILAAVVLIGTMFTGGFAVLGIPAGGYLVLYLAARLPRWLQWIGAKNDYSYGVYVYGFLVQQCLAYLGVFRAGYVLFTLAAVPITFFLAWLSWHVIEKRALALKNWGPGKGIAFWRSRWTSRSRSASTDASASPIGVE
ncbi:acyltransferase family protein [Microbacterium testaceum]|uniref:acyltransferase family protein n=1 Tax=Microbacterium testaceum TaxID=2033 RepID=UPI001246D1DE|nr:acyltransferase [Microbacterium testaceum]